MISQVFKIDIQRANEIENEILNSIVSTDELEEIIEWLDSVFEGEEKLFAFFMLGTLNTLSGFIVYPEEVIRLCKVYEGKLSRKIKEHKKLQNER